MVRLIVAVIGGVALRWLYRWVRDTPSLDRWATVVDIEDFEPSMFGNPKVRRA